MTDETTDPFWDAADEALWGSRNACYLTWYSNYEGDCAPEATFDNAEARQFDDELRAEYRDGLSKVRADDGRDHDVDLWEVEASIIGCVWGLDHADDMTGDGHRYVAYIQGVRAGLKALGATPRKPESTCG